MTIRSRTLPVVAMATSGRASQARGEVRHAPMVDVRSGGQTPGFGTRPARSCVGPSTCWSTPASVGRTRRRSAPRTTRHPPSGKSISVAAVVHRRDAIATGCPHLASAFAAACAAAVNAGRDCEEFNGFCSFHWLQHGASQRARFALLNARRRTLTLEAETPEQRARARFAHVDLASSASGHRGDEWPSTPSSASVMMPPPSESFPARSDLRARALL